MGPYPHAQKFKAAIEIILLAGCRQFNKVIHGCLLCPDFRNVNSLDVSSDALFGKISPASFVRESQKSTSNELHSFDGLSRMNLTADR